MSATTTPRLPLVDDGRLSGVGALLHELRPQTRTPGGHDAAGRARSARGDAWRRCSGSPTPGSVPTSSCSSPEGSAPPPSRRRSSPGLAVILAVFATIAVFMVSLSEPALRVPLIALVTFVAMALSRASKLGPVAFAAGFIIAYGLTIGDRGSRSGAASLGHQQHDGARTARPALCCRRRRRCCTPSFG